MSRRLLGLASDRLLWVLLAAALLLRVPVAATAAYLPDERELAIPLAESISLDPASPNLPLRGPHHPALPSYVVKASRSVFGPSPLGYRAFHVVCGMLSILIVYATTLRWAGRVAAGWAGALLAFNEYHVGVSAFATAKGPHLLLVAGAIAAFSRFLETEKPSSLYLTAALAALAFYCKEHAALLLPAFVLALALQPRFRPWLLRPHLYGAGLTFLLLIAPDLAWNLRGGQGGQATYLDHLSRVGGLGFTSHHLLFFARGLIQAAHVRLAGGPLLDDVEENPSMNSGSGLLLVACTSWLTLAARSEPGVSRLLPVLFWWILGVFVLIRPGQPTSEIDPVAWYWVDATLFPAVMAAGRCLAAGPLRNAVRAAAVAAMAYAALSVATGAFLIPPGAEPR